MCSELTVQVFIYIDIYIDIKFCVWPLGNHLAGRGSQNGCPSLLFFKDTKVKVNKLLAMKREKEFVVSFLESGIWSLA